MLIVLFISIFLCVVSIKNLPLGYTLCLLSKFIIPSYAKIEFGGISIGFYTFFFFLILALSLPKIKFDDLWHTPIIRITLIWMLLTIIVGMISRDAPLIYTIKSVIHYGINYIFFIIGWSIFRSQQQIKTFFILLFCLTFVICIYGLFEYIFKYNPYMEYITASYDADLAGETFYDDVRGIINGRIQAFTVHPLTHGQLMEVILPFVLIFNKEKKVIGGNLLVLLVIINIILAGSRSSIIATLLFIVLMLVNKQNFRKLVLYGMIILFAGIFVGGNLSGEIGSTFKNMVFFWNEDTSQEIHGSSVNSRLLQYAYMIEDLDAKLPIGHGLGYIQYDVDTNGDHPVMHGYESIILSKITEIGIIGFLIYLLWYLKLYLLSTKYYYSFKKGKYYKEIKYLILTYFVSILLTGEFVSGWCFFILLLVFYKYTRMSTAYSDIK